MRRLLKTLNTGGAILFGFALGWESESITSIEFNGLAYFALGVLFVTSAFYLVSAKKDVAILGMVGAGLGICLRASTAPEGQYADLDIARSIWGDAPSLLSYAIIGGVLSMEIGKLFRTARRWWREDMGGIGDDDEHRRSNTYERNRPFDH